MDIPDVTNAEQWLEWLRWIRNVGAGLVVLGVALELLGDWLARPYEKTVENARIAEIARASESAAKANEHAAQAEARAAEANLALEKFKAPRSLTVNQLNTIFNKIRSHAGVSIDILQYGENTEIANLLTLLWTPLQRAGWNPKTWSAVGSGRSATGVFVSVRVGATQAEQDAAYALISALLSEGIATGKLPSFRKEDWPPMVMGPPYDAAKQAPIEMILGHKP